MARPREHSDDELLDRISAALVGATESWTLADAARVAGVHPATLIKRFGSKHGVLVALSTKWSAAIPDTPQTHDCVAELESWVDGLAGPPHERTQAVASLTMLLEDMRDEELSLLLSGGWERQINYLAALLSAAHAAGKLTGSPTPATSAALLLDIVNGCYLRATATGARDSTANPRTLIRALMESWK